MEKKVFRLRIQITCKDVDMDMCPTTSSKTVFEDFYASKVAAIRQAQRRFAKRQLNDYVLDVHASVHSYIISDKGMTKGKQVYNLFKTQKYDIYGYTEE